MLKNIPMGGRARVASISNENPNYRKKLLTMGLTPGTEITVVRVAPMGDPIEIKVRGFSMTLRAGEAQALKVEVV